MKIPWKKIHKWIQKYKDNPVEAGSVLCLDPPYAGDMLRRQWKSTVEKIRVGEETGGVYAMILPVEGNNQLDILPANDLLIPYYRRRTVRIVGLASDRKEADLILVRMMTDCVHRRGDTDLKQFFLDRWRAEEVVT